MNALIKILGIVTLAFGMNLATVAEADAKRFGGGRTLGKTTMPSRAATAPRTPSQQAAATQNQQARQQLGQRGGLAGMLGGLAIGGLLGALFFGGAFENINFLDILLFGAIAYALYRLFAARQRGAPAASPAGGPAGDPNAAAFSADGDGERAGATQRPFFIPAPRGGAAVEASGTRPADFDEQAFLGGARRAFELLQDSWKTGDLSEIRGLTTDTLFGQLQDQINEAGTETFVQVLSVDARLLDVREHDGVQEATVMFDAVLREDEAERPAQVREIWHFTRPARAKTRTWFLDGIEQLED